MSVLCLCSVGTRDVQWEGKPLDLPREEGDKLLQEGRKLFDARETQTQAEWQAFQEKVSLPIIEPVLGYILSQHAALDRLILFVTDQDRNRAGEDHWQRDTVACGEFLRWWLLKGTGLGQKIRRITTYGLRGINPSVHDEAYNALGQALGRLYDPDVTHCYAVVSGGTPACNMALLLHATRLFQERCQAVYQPDRGRLFPLAIGQQLRGAMIRTAIEERVEQRDFAAALSLMQDLGYHPALCALVRYAKHRLYFDFDQAHKCLEQALRLSADRVAIRAWIERMGDPLAGLRGKELRSLLVELYHNAMISLHMQRYAGFLARIFLFQEAAARHIVEQAYGIGTDDTKDRQAFKEFIEGYPHLLKFMQGQIHRESGQPLEWDKINVPVLMALIRYIIEDGRDRDGAAMLLPEDVERCRAAYELLEKLDRLRSLRNKCIIAHGFEGVSDEKIRQEYGDGDPSSDMARLMELSGFSVEEDPFSRLADFVKEDLRLAP